MKEKSFFVPRGVDRTIFGILAGLFITTGLYAVGPWYLADDPSGGKAPLASLFSNHATVIVYGFLLCLTGIALIYAAAARGGTRIYSRVVGNALFTGVLLRLYTLFGVLLTQESWRPPGYLLQVFVVGIAGTMWLWVRISERPS